MKVRNMAKWSEYTKTETKLRIILPDLNLISKFYPLPSKN